MFLETANIFSPYIISQLISDIIMLACAVYHLDLVIIFNFLKYNYNFCFWLFKELKDLSFDICIVSIAFSIGLFNLFIWCYFGKFSSESYLRMADCLYEYNWQEIPIKLQKPFLIMITNAQRPLHYHGFGVPVLNLELFCKVKFMF